MEQVPFGESVKAGRLLTEVFGVGCVADIIRLQKTPVANQAAFEALVKTAFPGGLPQPLILKMS